ncbi:MAG: hypothetical protein ACLP50_31325 [Solirubrobacteraceae bacterium]
MQLSDDAVALADAQELVAVIVDGDDPRDLFECELGICRFGGLQLDGDLLIGRGLAKDRAGVSAAPINRERKPHSPVEAKRLAFGRPKAKGCGRLQRERSNWNQLSGVRAGG